mmetsp:Transcript_5303/g.12038  ORF Transcript_5303/g.12038 Transcript_5303/m.12038 type:complete len:602 (-) Transcript_5303:85-1890(-)
MTRDNLSLLFNAAAVPPPHRAASPINASNTRNEAVANFNQSSDCNNNSTPNENGNVASSHMVQSSAQKDRTTMPNRGHAKSDGELLVGFVDMPAAATSTLTSSAPPPSTLSTSSTTNSSNNHHSQRPPINNYTKPGTESIEYLKRFGSSFGSRALKPLRELQLAEKLNGMNVEIQEMQQEKEAERITQRHFQEQDGEISQSVVRRIDNESVMMDDSEQLARELQGKEEEEECERIKVEADIACQRVAGRYDALVKFTSGCPRGTYEEFVEFLLMGGGRSEGDDGGDDYDSLLFENFYDENSEYRKLWNDNLTMGLRTVEGRSFVPAVDSGNASGEHNHTDPWHYLSTEGNNAGEQRQRSFSEDERLRKFGQTLRDRTLSEGERIKNKIAQVDKQKIKQGFGSAVNAISNVSSFALKPLRDLQLAEKLNAINIDMEEEEARKEIEQYNRMQRDKRDLEDMMKLKKEAEDSCMKATKEHLLGFIKDDPNAKYHQWIEEFHPENAHDGTLLEGMGKTIDHRFFVEESDHRHLWNENLFTFLDPKSSEGRDFVPARARQMNDDGEMVVATDLLSGSVVDREEVAPHNEGGKSEDALKNSDMIAFD